MTDQPIYFDPIFKRLREKKPVKKDPRAVFIERSIVNPVKSAAKQTEVS